MFVFKVSWDDIQRDCRALAWRLREIKNFKRLIAITRGGLVPAALVARELDIRHIDTICIIGYDYNQKTDLRVVKEVTTSGEDTLVIDDLVDTGATLTQVRRMVPQAHYATVYVKPAGRDLVDTYITEVAQNTWIEFPWEQGIKN